ncbi:hypothetical protein [uncultured Sphaerochaeta sp.]|uniref:hypothetical protein n=1 Tax=uncultured Sphaerochaeta sp. TaxID=886478 RepID=UPI002A0A4FE2|nr:hypothetical protein [uncultured Sphaerochaeta sp.]
MGILLCSKWYRATGTPEGPNASAFLSALVTNNAAIRAHHVARKDIYDELTIQECLAHFAPVTSPTAPGIRVANTVRSGMDTYLGDCCR